MCTLNQAISYMTSVPTLMLHMFISWERYRAVLHFFEWKPYSKKTHLELGVMWTFAVVMGVLGVLQCSQIIGETDDIISCFVPSRWSTEQFLFVQILILITGSLIGPASLLFCIVHYIYIFRKLRTIRKIHNSNGIMPPVLNTIDTPINSLAIAFFMAVVPYIYSANIIYVVVESISLIEHRKFSDGDSPLSLFDVSCIILFIAHIRSHSNICSKQKIQSEKKELFKWQLKPDSANIPGNTVGITKNKSLRMAMQCDGGSIDKPVITIP